MGKGRFPASPVVFNSLRNHSVTGRVGTVSAKRPDQAGCLALGESQKLSQAICFWPCPVLAADAGAEASRDAQAGYGVDGVTWARSPLRSGKEGADTGPRRAGAGRAGISQRMHKYVRVPTFPVGTPNTPVISLKLKLIIQSARVGF